MTRPKTEAEAKAKTEAEARPKTEAEARPKTEAEARPKTEAEARPKTEAEAKAADSIFQNVSNANIYTTRGRVGIEGIIELPNNEGDAAKGLERV